MISLIVLISCVDEIDLNVDTEQRTLVVDGFVSDVEGEYTLELSESSVIGVGRDNILTPVEGAVVTLMSDNGGSFSYEEIEPGTYTLNSFAAQRDVAYNIDIVLSTGEHYQSRPSELRSSSDIQSVSFEVGEQTFRNNLGEFVTQDIISVQLESDIPDTQEAPYLRWRVSGEYALTENYPDAISPRTCYIKTNLDLNDIRILDATELANNRIFGQVIAEAEYDFKFSENYCFHIQQFSISEEEYTYWRNIKEIIEIDGGLFDPPPGTLVGNIFNVDDSSVTAVGYFSVSSLAFKREFINGSSLEMVVQPYCQLRFGREPPFGCEDCTEFRDSELEKPDYWIF
jgi:hypothetical protein